MSKEEQSFKTFNVRLPLGLWKYTKIAATTEDMSMQDFVIRALENFKVIPGKTKDAKNS